MRPMVPFIFLPQKSRTFYPLFGLFLLFFTLVLPGLPAAQTNDNNTLRVAYFSQDPPAISPLTTSFDPDSYAVITQIFDSLIHLDLEGNIQPALATHWQKKTPTHWVFNLRQGVRFHNGEPFDGHAVKFTYETALNPLNQSGNSWILNSIKSIEVEPDNPYLLHIHTHFPDGMFLNRFSMFGSICPPQYIQQVGLEAFAKHPIGTGPYRFVDWQRGKSITLKKNIDYWKKNIPHIETIQFVVIPDQKWADAFLQGEVDFIPNLAGNQTSRLMQITEGRARILKKLVLSSYWVMVQNRGVLADRRVRQALNHALNKKDLVRFADQGNAIPMASMGKRGEFGRNPQLKPYPYNPSRAKALLQEAGVKGPITLTVLVADLSHPVARIMKENFSQVGIDLALTVVSRSVLTKWVVEHKLKTGVPIDYDLVISLVDNPLYSLAFHAGLLLHSQSPWSLLNHAPFDAAYEKALRIHDPVIHRQRLEHLDTLIHQEALMIFTTQRILTAAIDRRIQIPTFSTSGHLDYEVLTTATFK